MMYAFIALACFVAMAIFVAIDVSLPEHETGKKVVTEEVNFINGSDTKTVTEYVLKYHDNYPLMVFSTIMAFVFGLLTIAFIIIAVS